MFRLEGARPGDVRGFLHKSFIGKAVGKAVTTFVPGASTAVDVFSTARTLLGGRGPSAGGGRGFGRRPARATVSRTTTARPSLAGAQGKALGRDLKFGGDVSIPGPAFTTDLFRPSAFAGIPKGASGTGPCPSGTVPDPEGGGFCVSPKSPFGKGRGAERAPVGDAVMGRYGAALEPGVMIVERSVCLPGMNLGNDGLCYNRGAITNSQRQWPRGRRPLLTGGDMNAISIAARAGSKLERTTKRLRSLGLMKKLPAGRGATRAHAHAKPIAAVSV